MRKFKHILKILLINDYGSPVGGAEIMTLTLREALIERGHVVKIFSSTSMEIPKERFANYYCFGTDHSKIRMLSQVVNPSALWNLRSVLKEFRPDVIHIRMFLWQLSPLILPLLKNIPTIYHVVTYKPICPLGKKLLPDDSFCQDNQGVPCYKNGCLSLPAWGISMVQQQLWQKWKNRINLIIANSHYVAQQLNKAGMNNIKVVWNGVPLRSMRPPLPEKPLAVYAGRLSREKGVDILIRAFASIREQVPAAELWIAGDGAEKQLLLKLCDRLNLNGVVTFLGHLDRQIMESRFEKAWVQVIPSRWAEPFGIAAAEGMIRGTAVIASNSGGLAEIIQHEKTGYLVPPANVELMAEQLIRLLANRSLADEMGRQGRDFALRYFTTEIYTNQILEAYHQVLTRTYLPNKSPQ